MLIDKIWTKFRSIYQQLPSNWFNLSSPQPFHYTRFVESKLHFRLLHFRLGGRNRKCNNRKCKNSLAMFKFIDKKIIFSGSMLLCNIWIKFYQSTFLLLVGSGRKFRSIYQQLPSYWFNPTLRHTNQMCFVPTFPLYRFCWIYYIFGYYIFGWVVATVNVITVNVIIVWLWLNNSLFDSHFPFYAFVKCMYMYSNSNRFKKMNNQLHCAWWICKKIKFNLPTAPK